MGFGQRQDEERRLFAGETGRPRLVRGGECGRFGGRCPVPGRSFFFSDQCIRRAVGGPYCDGLAGAWAKPEPARGEAVEAIGAGGQKKGAISASSTARRRCLLEIGFARRWFWPDLPRGAVRQLFRAVIGDEALIDAS